MSNFWRSYSISNERSTTENKRAQNDVSFCPHGRMASRLRGNRHRLGQHAAAIGYFDLAWPAEGQMQDDVGSWAQGTEEWV